ncbi:Phospholipase/carboxylesterase/thioesterase [Suillus subaureus]|uniref:Acyl-protein thioesterase 1 n=1 Tax=Suillus subaureus TaxID=48587 RepID=A0A9P7EB27_9AGAM|nr:Phospholipase/carboxylesterase/thioesterase [Suillus subaureus]KAG1815719.1 Phospholipase/carboxylesterase/thioesterase [Suillus subaureus]
MMSLPLTFVTITPKTKHTATVIFAHGLGDNGLEFSNNKEMRTIASQLPHIKWVFPNAPERSITAWKGDTRRQSSTRGWFDVLREPLMYSSEHDDIKEYDEGIMQSVKHLDAFIQSEINSGGFGQGGAISLITGLGDSQWRGTSDTKDGWKLGGIICLGGWLPMREKYKKRLSMHASTIPVFWGHGVQNESVTWDLSWESARFIGDKLEVRYGQYTKVGESGVSFMSYGVAHWMAESEMEDLRLFLKKVLPWEG